MKRSEYMASCAEDKTAHRRYYGQFVGPYVISLVRRIVGDERLLKSTDPHFNDIPLRVWDMCVNMIPASVGRDMKEQGDYLTLAGGVCVLKEAARQFVDEKRA